MGSYLIISQKQLTGTLIIKIEFTCLEQGSVVNIGHTSVEIKLLIKQLAGFKRYIFIYIYDRLQAQPIRILLKTADIKKY